ncbi:RraA family protein [Micromonospora profundi]|uniref:RraA family protein n=1 Tax=Micromonospora profundi TaxID=1420889 RepID=UPI0033BA23A4
MSTDRAGFPGSCDISDTCDELGIPAVRTGLLRPVWPGPPVLGPVSTLTLSAEIGGDPLADVLSALGAMPPGGVALIDLGGRVDLQCWGGRTTAAARHAGLVGALVNGAVRDSGELRGLEFPTFARGTFPARAKGRLGFRGVGHDVRLGGEVVRNGSAVVADDDGLVFFPYDTLPDVLSRARDMASS